MKLNFDGIRANSSPLELVEDALKTLRRSWAALCSHQEITRAHLESQWSAPAIVYDHAQGQQARPDPFTIWVYTRIASPQEHGEDGDQDNFLAGIIDVIYEAAHADEWDRLVKRDHEFASIMKSVTTSCGISVWTA